MITGEQLHDFLRNFGAGDYSMNPSTRTGRTSSDYDRVLDGNTTKLWRSIRDTLRAVGFRDVKVSVFRSSPGEGLDRFDFTITPEAAAAFSDVVLAIAYCLWPKWVPNTNALRAIARGCKADPGLCASFSAARRLGTPVELLREMVEPMRPK